MIGNLPGQSDKDEESRFLLLALGEGISDYIQGAAYARNNSGMGDLTKDFLDFDTPVQSFAAGGAVSLKPGLGVTEDNPLNFPFDDPFGDPNVVRVGTVKPMSAIIGGIGSDDVGPDAGVNSVAGTVAGLMSLAIDVAQNTPSFIGTAARMTGLVPSIDTTALNARSNLDFSSTEAEAAVAAEVDAQEAQSGAAEVGAEGQAAADAAEGNDDGATAGGDTGSVGGGEDGPGAGGDGGAAGSAGAAGDASGGAGASGEGASGGEGGVLARGGVVKGYQEGDLVAADQADTQLDTLGLGSVGLVDDPNGTTGVADDLDMELPVNSYVVNKDAATLAGLGSINKLIKDAIDLALEDEVDLPAEIKTAEKIPIRISKGEIVIPAPLVDYIGLKKLENMNKRGLKVRKQREAEEAPVEVAAAPSLQQDLLAQIQPVA
jgi:hypothetical protein